MFIAQSARAERDDEFTLSSVRRLHINAEDPGTRRRIHAKDLRWSGATLQTDLHIPFGKRFEGIEPRQMNGETRRGTDSE
jgi:hypothetical protein